MNIIVDKSWITKIGRKELVEFSKNNVFILIDSFGYELFTTEQNEDKKRKQVMSIWQKLFSIRESVRLTYDFGYFIDYEVNNCQPVKSINNHFLPINFNPCKNLLDGTAIFKYEEVMSLFEHTYHNEIEEVKSYKNISAGVHNYITELRDLKSGCKRDPIMSIYEKVAMDDEFVLFVYNDIRPDNFPPTNIINKNWMIFRWLQVQLLYGIEYVRKYGTDNLLIDTPKFINTNIDKNYVILSVLADSIATNDNDLKFFFRLIYPEKKIF